MSVDDDGDIEAEWGHKSSKSTVDYKDFYSIDGLGNNKGCSECTDGSANVCLKFAAGRDSKALSQNVNDFDPLDDDPYETAYYTGECARPNCTDLEDYFKGRDVFINSVKLSILPVMLGQFSLSHDAALSPPDSNNCNTDQLVFGQPFCRSIRLNDNANCVGNIITSWLDLSAVYGSDDDVFTRLVDPPFMIMPDGLLPKECAKRGLHMDDLLGNSPDELFCAGDVRANENFRLTAYHWLFVAEHNRLAQKMVDYGYGKKWSNEQIFAKARAINIAQYQAILKYEWMKVMIGPTTWDSYFGEGGDYYPYKYTPQTNPDSTETGPGIFADHSVALYRQFRNLLQDMIQQPVWKSDDYQRILLGESLFTVALGGYGPEVIFQGMVFQAAQRPGKVAITELQSSHKVALHLFTLDCMRPREVHVADYKTFTHWQAEALNRPYLRWDSDDLADITTDRKRYDFLDMYRQVNPTYWTDNLDLGVTALMEDQLPDAPFGKTMTNFLAYQFHALTEGDRYWFENDYNKLLTSQQKYAVSQTTIAELLLRNLDLKSLPREAFKTPKYSSMLWADELKVKKAGGFGARAGLHGEREKAGAHSDREKDKSGKDKSSKDGGYGGYGGYGYGKSPYGNEDGHGGSGHKSGGAYYYDALDVTSINKEVF
eukprot:Filipodium_phascolosomae@DN4562_c0_g1_i1.p1